MHCGDQRHLGLCLGYARARAAGSPTKAQPCVPLISTMHGQPFLIPLINPRQYFMTHATPVWFYITLTSHGHHDVLNNHNSTVYINGWHYWLFMTVEFPSLFVNNAENISTPSCTSLIMINFDMNNKLQRVTGPVRQERDGPDGQHQSVKTSNFTGPSTDYSKEYPGEK